MKEERIEDEIEIIQVERSEDAEKLKFVGSPTILVNGHDIDSQKNPHYALTCRAYLLEDGRISPLPSEMMIRKAMREASIEET